jgi:hypothetical protein
MNKRNYIVRLHEKISVTSPIIRDMAQPMEVTPYSPSNVPSQVGLAIRISNHRSSSVSNGVPKCQE